MKHFLIVHSSITWLIVQKIIETEQLPLQDCVILSDRRMPIPTGEYIVKDISGLILHDLKGREINRLFPNQHQNQQYLQKIDQLIAETCPAAEKFQLYLPHHRDLRYWAFTTHAQCTHFFYTEEGTVSYWGNRPHTTTPQYNGWHWELKRFILTLSYDWFLQGRAPALPHNFYPNHPKYGGAYGLSKLVFPGMSQVKVLPLPFEHLPEWEHAQRVLVFGPYVEFGQLPQAIRLRVTRALFEYFIQQGISTIYFKFHPAQYAHPQNLQELKTLLSAYRDRIQFTEIPQTVSLENIAYSSKADFYLITSSVAMYTVLCGSRVISYARQVLKYHPAFQQTLDAVPQNVWNKLEFVEF